MEREESVSHRAEGGVVMKATPCSSLEMIETDLVFHFLIIALDAPAKFCESDQ